MWSSQIQRGDKKERKIVGKYWQKCIGKKEKVASGYFSASPKDR